jgi:phage gp16-like protein
MAGRGYYLGAIHKQAKTLELGEEAYRNVLAALTGKRSCTDLSLSELRQVKVFLGREINQRLPAMNDEEALAILGMAA